MRAKRSTRSVSPGAKVERGTAQGIASPTFTGHILRADGATPPMCARQLLKVQRRAGNRAATAVIRRQSERLEAAKSAHAPKEPPRFGAPSRATLTNVHNLGFDIELDTSASLQAASQYLFGTDWAPAGLALTGQYQHWSVRIIDGRNLYTVLGDLDDRVVRLIEREVRDRVVRLSPEQTAEARRIRRERWESTLDFVGLKVKEVAQWQSGPYEIGGHFIYVEHRLRVAVLPLYDSETLNNDMRWYLRHGTTIEEARQLMQAQWRSMNRMALASFALVLAGGPSRLTPSGLGETTKKVLETSEKGLGESLGPETVADAMFQQYPWGRIQQLADQPTVPLRQKPTSP